MNARLFGHLPLLTECHIRPTMKRNTFPLKEHLKSKRTIERVYSEGSSVTSYPLRAVFLEIENENQEPRAAVLINVAKKRFRHAVDRNLVKRRIREAYRTSKHQLIDTLEANGKKIAIAILYIDTKHNSTAFLKKKMTKLLDNIITKVGSNEETACQHTDSAN